jgi:hypothetical protein
MALVINSTTGEIDLSASTAGTYTVTYTVGLDTATTQVIINNPPNAVITGDSTYCQGEAGVTLSANSGNYSYLWSTGETTQTIDVTAGTYNCVITDLGNGNCSDQSQDKQVTVTPRDNSSFTYSSSSYSQSGTDPTPTITGLTGGTFTATRGLVINSSTGEIDLSTSTIGEHTVTYTTNGPCPSSSTFTIGITAGFVNNYSLDLDGTNDYTQGSQASSLQGSASCTVMAWVRFDQTPVLEPIAHQWVNPNYVYLLRWSNGAWQFYIRGNGVTRLVYYSNTPSTNTWFHIVGVKDGTTLRLYLNGTQVATNSTSIPANLQNNTSGMISDRTGWYGNSYYGGQIDELALWTSAVSASNISTIYNSGNGAIDLTPYSPVNWWRFEEGTGQSTADSGSGNTQMNFYNGATFNTNTP